MVGACKSQYFAFIHISKTGGSSINDALKPLTIPYRSLGGNRTFLYQPEFGHSMYSEYYNCFGAAFIRFYTFAIVRNPFERLVSMYHYWQKDGVKNPHPYNRGLDTLTGHKSFHEWVKIAISHWSMNRHFVCQAAWIIHEGTIAVDYLGRFERLDEDFEVVCKTLKIEGLTLPHLNKSKHSSYRDYYDSETRGMVESIYAYDFNTFGYRW